MKSKSSSLLVHLLGRASMQWQKTSQTKKKNWRIASIGNVTTKAIVTDGWDVTYQAETFTMKHLADLIIQEEYK